MMRNIAWAVTASVVIGLAAGCGGGASGAKPAPVKGRILLDGKPLEGATVTFIPESGKGQPASGRTDSQGQFVLTTHNTGDGAVPGSYKVTVRKELAIAGGEALDPSKPGPQYFEMMKKAGEQAKGAKSEVHPNYADPNKTPLKYTVPASGLDVEIKLNKEGTAG
ncbi:MAG: hypothetical protein C4297_04290 [Gemmataceae bacterium]